MEYVKYIKPELLILIPVMVLLGAFLKKSKCKDKHIPLCIGGASVLLSMLWVLSAMVPSGISEISLALFTAVTQGILIAGAAIYAHQLYKQAKK